MVNCLLERLSDAPLHRFTGYLCNSVTFNGYSPTKTTDKIGHVISNMDSYKD